MTISNKINQKERLAQSSRNGSLIARLQNEGASMTRRMASSIRSGPDGARGVFRSNVTFPIFYFSIDAFFL